MSVWHRHDGAKSNTAMGARTGGCWLNRHRLRRRRAALGAAPAGLRGPPAPGAKASAVRLPGQYSVLTTVGNKLVLTGPPSGTDIPGADLSCDSVVVDPATLKLSRFSQASCADPRLWGEAVPPVFSIEQHVFWGHGSEGINTGEVRIARLSGAAPGYSLGPVVLRYPNASGRPQWATGAGYLWLSSGTSGPHARDLPYLPHDRGSPPAGGTGGHRAPHPVCRRRWALDRTGRTGLVVLHVDPMTGPARALTTVAAAAPLSSGR